MRHRWQLTVAGHELLGLVMIVLVVLGFSVLVGVGFTLGAALARWVL